MSDGFSQKETIDKPGIIGARWWQESIANEVPRRKAIKTLLVFGGALGVLASIGYFASRKASASSSTQYWDPDNTNAVMKNALEMQREFGWSFGATGETLVFDGTTTKPFDPKTLETMTTDLAPGNGAYAPYFVPTLFQSPGAMPKSKPSGDPNAPPFQPLKEVIIPIHRPSMDVAFDQGKALAAMLTGSPRGKHIAVVVDLPGPEAVAFAAGAAGMYDPVFLFDNWPHPHGVVPSHLTLAAALYYQPLFAKARAQSATAMPMFVIDRDRLVTYVDDIAKFDNRFTARMPTTASLASAGVQDILYVGPNGIQRTESDDLVDYFLTYQNAHITFHTCPATAFENVYYGGSPTMDRTFWQDYDQKQSQTDKAINEAQQYTPAARKSQFSSGISTESTTHPAPPGFGTVPVVVALATGAILGASASRSGSWNRTSSSSSSSGS